MFFIVCCTSIYLSYSALKIMLNKHSKSFNMSSRKNYIVKNILKAFILFFLVIACLVLVFPYNWNNENIKLIASAYVANDFVGLLTCKLPYSTLLHHIVSCIFLIFAQYVDFSKSLEAQMLFYYSFFSACTFCVNLYLGLRLFEECDWLKQVCKFVYPFFLFLNWSIQLYNVFHLQTWYLGLLMFIVYDDIVLLRWLWR